MSTLTAIDELMYDRFEVNKVLVIAPLRVARSTWPAEVKTWEHLQHLRVSCILGTKQQRVEALQANADVWTINRENVVWLVEHLKSNWDFDMVVIDELSSFKSTRAKRFKALRRVKAFINVMVGLTGTPAPNSLLELWPQMYLLDQGEALGKTVTGYRNRYFYPLQMNGHIVYKYGLRPGAEEAIHKAIADTCISMKAEDWLDMPDYISNELRVELPAKLKRHYVAFQKEKVLELEDTDVIGVNAGAMFNKLLQFANGAIYDSDHNTQLLHDLKLDALAEIISEANGQSVMVFYNFKHDLVRLRERFLQGRMLQTSKDETDWNEGNIELLFVHPASAGHGLNLQKGGHIAVWFGLTCSLELYQQANARLYRQGQAHESVIIHHIIAGGTFDELVMQKLASKEINQNALLEALKRGGD